MRNQRRDRADGEGWPASPIRLPMKTPQKRFASAGALVGNTPDIAARRLARARREAVVPARLDRLGLR